MQKFMTFLMVKVLCVSFCLAADVSNSSEHPDFTLLRKRATVSEHFSLLLGKRLRASADYQDDSQHKQIALNMAQEITKKLPRKTNYEFSTAELANLLFQTYFGSRVLKVESLSGGFVSGIVYRVYTHNPHTQEEEQFYIKYLRTKPLVVSGGRCHGELANLDFLTQNPIVQKMQEILTIVLPVMMFQYRIPTGRIKKFIILPAALGKSYTQIVEEGDPKKINSAFIELGKKLGKLHVHYRHHNSKNNTSPLTEEDFINTTVYAHGDCHGDNVFYDEQTGTVFFIDSESMAYSFDDEDGHPIAPVCYDLLYMMVMASKKFKNYMPKNNWEPFKKLFEAYIEAYPKKERIGICDYWSYCLNKTTNIKFTDIYRNFTMHKGFNSETVEGAKEVAEYVDCLRADYFLNSLRDQPTDVSPDTLKRSMKFKEDTKQRYKTPPQRRVLFRSQTTGPSSVAETSPNPPRKETQGSPERTISGLPTRSSFSSKGAVPSSVRREPPLYVKELKQQLDGAPPTSGSPKGSKDTSDLRISRRRATSEPPIPSLVSTPPSSGNAPLSVKDRVQQLNDKGKNLVYTASRGSPDK